MAGWFSFRPWRRKAPRPRVILHVGRNKAGSTTIQDFCLAAREALAARGVDYALFGHLKDSVPGVPGYGTFEELALAAHAAPGRTQLVSNEFMFGWPPEYTAGARRDLADCDCRIVVYLRPYDGWAQSAYSEDTKRGRSILDVDSFIRDYPPAMSAWPYLEEWADNFGWDKFHIRTLNRTSLLRGDLLVDFLDAIGITEAISPGPRRNASPHWAVVELARRLAKCSSDFDWDGVDFAEIEPLLATMEIVAKGSEIPLLTLDQRRELIALYNADLDRIVAAGGPRLPKEPMPTGPERPYLPALGNVPDMILTPFFDVVLSADFAGRHMAAGAKARELAGELGYLEP